jgi:uncharacterized protein (TIGR00369 family)
VNQQIPLHQLLGFEFDAPPQGSQVAEVHMPVRPEAFGFTANLHGGAIATLIDLSCGLVAARATDFDPTSESLVTSDMHIRYLGRARTDRVTARSEIVRLGSQLIIIDCKVVDGDEHLVAVADFSMMRVPLRRPLDPTITLEPGDPEL